MNLLMISGDRSVLSGKHSAFWYTLEAFSKRWGRIDVICPRVVSASKNPDALTFFGNVHFHPCPQGLWYQSRWIAHKGRQLHALYKHQVLTAHDYPPFYNSIGAARLLRTVRMGSVIEIHHLVGFPKPADVKERIGRILSHLHLPAAIRRFSAVRTVSKSTAERLIAWGVDRKKVHVVPSFYLDHRLFASLHPVQKQYDIAFCSRLVRNKGLDRLLRAVAKLPRATLLVIGDGPDRIRCEHLARQLDISERVEFRGWLETREDVLHAVTLANIFVMNSLSEGGPRIALEAMAAGMPVIATHVGVMDEVIQEGVNGFFTSGEPEDLAPLMQRVLAERALRERIGAQARMVLDRFEREKLIDNYARFLQSCVHHTEP